ncbi:hypothetical protein SAMN05443287_103284 [Micromonospora phaseoli]|uniref:Integral membrane protein n=1 Tax=Micromonospora phaseoli TaxID=1144548 RepID=A0A1H6WQL9_9ACTN|nr:hypothetical protein [Micromonospora phaseoli]PZW01914.1 hypothetical protein CLV64_102283 [Micromonospora phaseoli]GIJ80640.1 hypothetical protein Xph01_50720 [Micromonospora phaseoli]SEJ19329.1 hypothetical protein SAMN05443287_103284 [Micromonospora phaseoli]
MSGRILELRVHGVSNTPPADALGLTTEPGGETPQPRLVAGGPVTGFYRSATTAPLDPIVVEAYSWGQLTSGARTARDVERAMWTLLLPFTLANVALHARPGIPPDPNTERLASRSGITAWLIRLFCLTLTATPVLALTGVGVDLIGWQCVDESCLRRIPGPWELLASPWWQQGGRALAVGLAVPLALIAVLGVVTWRTYQYESVMPADPTTNPPGRGMPAPVDVDVPTSQPVQDAPPAPEPSSGPPTNPLQDPTFWWGEGQLRRAAVLHLCTATVVAVAVPLGTVAVLDPPHGARAVVAWSAVAAMVVVLLITLVAIGRPFLTRRDGATPLGPWSIAVIVLTGLGVAGTVAVLMLPEGAAGAPLAQLRPPAGCGDDPALPGCLADRSLPGFDRIIAWLGTGQLLLLIAIGATARSGRRGGATPAVATVLIAVGAAWCHGWLPAAPPAPLAMWQLTLPLLALAAAGLLLPRTRPTAVKQPLEPHTDLAWQGRAPAVIAGFGWLLCLAYSTGVLYWVADRLNGDATPSGRSPVVPPTPVTWAGLSFGVALLLLVLVALRAVVLYHRLRREEYAELRARGGRLSAHDLRRGRDVSTHQALHRLVGEHALRLTGWYAGTMTVLAGLGCVAVLSSARPQMITTGGTAAVVKAVADVGDSLLGWLPVAVAAVGLLVYRNDTVRRSVGVVWDVGTFWPRAAHPLAPPSYAERAVPELLTRTAGLLALTEHDPRRMDGIILSGHSQGTVICTAVILQLPSRWRRRVWFFSYGCQLTRLYGRIFPAYFGPDRLPVLTEALTRPAGGTRWTNFWRDTDPLGWPVTAGERDIAVTDPEALHPSDGEVADPPIRSHSGYPEAAEFHRERSRVAWLLRRAVPSPRRGLS